MFCEHVTRHSDARSCARHCLLRCVFLEVPYRPGRLEIDYWLDCMEVLHLQQSMPVPLHRLVQNGEQLWQQLRRSRVGA